MCSLNAILSGVMRFTFYRIIIIHFVVFLKVYYFILRLRDYSFVSNHREPRLEPHKF